MKRTAFQRQCDAAWKANPRLDVALSSSFWEDADALEAGTPTNLYLVRDVATGAVKFGVGLNPVARLVSLQIGNPSELELVDWAPATRDIEQRFHTLLADHRLRGEWFAPHAEVLVACELIMAAGDHRRTMEGSGETATAEDTLAMLGSSAEWAVEWAANNPVQLVLEVAA